LYLKIYFTQIFYNALICSRNNILVSPAEIGLLDGISESEGVQNENLVIPEFFNSQPNYVSCDQLSDIFKFEPVSSSFPYSPLKPERRFPSDIFSSQPLTVAANSNNNLTSNPSSSYASLSDSTRSSLGLLSSSFTSSLTSHNFLSSHADVTRSVATCTSPLSTKNVLPGGNIIQNTYFSLCVQFFV